MKVNCVRCQILFNVLLQISSHAKATDRDMQPRSVPIRRHGGKRWGDLDTAAWPVSRLRVRESLRGTSTAYLPADYALETDSDDEFHFLPHVSSDQKGTDRDLQQRSVSIRRHRGKRWGDLDTGAWPESRLRVRESLHDTSIAYLPADYALETDSDELL